MQAMINAIIINQFGTKRTGLASPDILSSNRFSLEVGSKKIWWQIQLALLVFLALSCL